MRTRFATLFAVLLLSACGSGDSKDTNGGVDGAAETAAAEGEAGGGADAGDAGDLGGADNATEAEADAEPAADAEAARAGGIADGPHDVAVLTIRDLGRIKIELLPEVAPKTVENFVRLAAQGYYDGTQFHRVIPGFMIQGGDPNTKQPDPRQYGRGGPGYTIPDEMSALPHERGMVSMANTGTPNSGGSQFFILHADAKHLDGRHAIFGRVIEGMDVVDAIVALPRDDAGRYGPRNRPYPEPALVETVEIEFAPLG